MEELEDTLPIIDEIVPCNGEFRLDVNMPDPLWRSHSSQPDRLVLEQWIPVPESTQFRADADIAAQLPPSKLIPRTCTIYCELVGPSTKITLHSASLSDNLILRVRTPATSDGQPLTLQSLWVELDPIDLLSNDSGVCDHHVQLLARYVCSPSNGFRGFNLQGKFPSPELVSMSAFATRGFIGPDELQDNTWWKPTPYVDCVRVHLPSESVEPKLKELPARVLSVLNHITIRQITLGEVLLQLAFRKGVSYPLAICGGCVRDLVQGKDLQEINDIDISVGGSFDETLHALQDIFAPNGSFAERDLLVTKAAEKYGQAKVRNTRGEKEPLDVALFKARRTGNAAAPFEFGWSYSADCRSRDTTLNSLYLQLFPTLLLIDPTERGLQDALSGNKYPIYKHFNDPGLLEQDLGGQFRLWKAYVNGEINEDTDVIKIEVAGALKRSIAKINSSQTAAGFFGKLFGKVWKSQLPSDTQLKDFVEKSRLWMPDCLDLAIKHLDYFQSLRSNRQSVELRLLVCKLALLAAPPDYDSLVVNFRNGLFMFMLLSGAAQKWLQ